MDAKLNSSKKRKQAMIFVHEKAVERKFELPIQEIAYSLLYVKFWGCVK